MVDRKEAQKILDQMTPENWQRLVDLGEPVNEETLHPGLKKWMRYDTALPVLSHPLMVVLVPSGPKFLAVQYEQKVLDFGRYVKQGNLPRALMVVEKPYRLTMVDCWLRGGRVMPDDDVAKELFTDAWVACEAPWQDEWRARSMLRQIGYVGDVPQPEADREYTVYRGQSHEHELGLSWSLTKSVADWFSQRFRDKGEPRLVVAGRVRGDKIRARFEGRGETEAVVFPEDVTDIERWELD